MRTKARKHPFRLLAWFLATALAIVGFGGASLFTPMPELHLQRLEVDGAATDTLQELHRLGLLAGMSQTGVEDFLTYKGHSHKSLAQIVSDPHWCKQLGLTSTSFKATWYAANPFDFLPKDFQQAIRSHSTVFHSRRDIVAWCKSRKAPEKWFFALNNALIETTPENLWRAAHGKPSFAKNGQFLEPIVIQHGKDDFEARDGHIATDPRVIPTNSRVLMLIRIQGKERLLQVKAADIGAAIRGNHVDLPIRIHPGSADGGSVIHFPKNYIGNDTVEILTVRPPTNRGRKA